MWRERLRTLDPEVRFQEPVRAEQLDELDRAVRVTVPADLTALLSETNGVSDRYRAELVWSVELIIAVNHSFRTSPEIADLYMPFDSLLFFGDAGKEDQFAFPITSTRVRDEVFVWDHEDDSRRWYAASLGQYLESWLSEYPLYL